MTRFTTAALALGLALPLLPIATPQAEAQGNLCRNRVFIDTVYQDSLGGNRYEYFVQVRNGTNAPIRTNLNFAGFGPTVTLFSASLPDINLAAHTNRTIRFGNGTNGNINSGTVALSYDTPAGGGRPTVTAVNCR